MTTIFTLPPEIFRLIAAGEVVQHPTGAVKELIENAIDAQSTQIFIEATGAGYDSVVVVDNGHGMNADDLELAWQAHTTSKLKSLEDLEAIVTFGFRGEALQSLAQVSRLELQSRTAADAIASVISLEQGRVVSPRRATAGNVGTRVSFASIFSNVPGRRKPRSAKVETKQLVDLVSAYAIIFPDITWRLTVDGQTWNWHGPATLRDRAVQHWTNASPADFWPLQADVPGGSVYGILAEPHLARRKHQGICSINGRWVVWPALATTVRQAYSTTLEAGMHPAWTLHFQLDPRRLDQNIHPTKHEIRVFDEDAILATLLPTLQQTLSEHLLALQKQKLWRVGESSPDQSAGQHLKTTVSLPMLETSQLELAQLQKLYLVTQSSEGLLLIDQHAAHERVLYEEFLSAWQNQDHAANVELTPARTMHVSASDDLLLQEHQENLEATGWELEPFGTHTWAIRAMPALLQDRDPVSLLKAAVDDVSVGLLEGSLHPHHHRLLATLACRSAIKAGQELSQDARIELIKQLSRTTTNFSCPHGRPVSVTIPWREVEKWFHRA